MAFTLIQEQILTSNQTSVTFSNIPSSYKDLQIYVSARSSAPNALSNAIALYFNSSTSGYAGRTVYGNGSWAGWNQGIGSDVRTDAWGFESTANSATTSSFAGYSIYVPNYANNGYSKGYLSMGGTEDNAVTAYSIFAYTTWTGTAPISSIEFKSIAASRDLVTNSTFQLYGVST